MRLHPLSGRLLPLAAATFAVAALLAAVIVMAAPADATVATQSSERPAWHLLPLVDARTGESFTLADLAGKTV
jgi:hypothetical protein